MSKSFLKSVECLVMAFVMIAAVVSADVMPVFANESVSQQTLIQESPEATEQLADINSCYSEETVNNEGLILTDSILEDESFVVDETYISNTAQEPELSDNSEDDFTIELDTAGGTSKEAPLNIQIGTEYQDTLTDNISERYYQFTLSQAGRVSFSFKHDRVDVSQAVWELSIYNSDSFADKNRIESVTYTGNETKEVDNGLVGLAQGAYYVVIKRYDRYSSCALGQQYSFKVNFEASEYWEREIDSAVNQTPVFTDEWINGSIQKGSNTYDYDYYKFDMTENGRISFSFKHDRLNTSVNVWELALYNSDSFADKNLVETVRYVGNETKEVENGLAGLPKGTYYLMIGRYDIYSSYALGAQYSFKINYEASEYWEKEIDSAINHTLIETNTWISGSIQNDPDLYDYDYYSFDMPGDGDISFSFSHDRISTSNRVWELSLYNSDSFANKDCLETVGYVGNETAVVENGKISLSKGAYYIIIERSDKYSSYALGQQYSFKVNSPFNTSTNLTITFKSDDKVYATQTVKKDECATKPKDPVKQGYTFDGWYDSSYKNKFDFSTKITANMTLYAKWIRNTGSLYANNLTLVAGRKVNIKEVCFPGLSVDVSRYTVNNTKLASQSKGSLKVKKAGVVEVVAQSSVNGNYEDVGVCSVTILSKPKLKFTVPMTYQGQTINASDFFTTSDTMPSQVTLWESSKPDAIRVLDAKTGRLEAVGNGSAKITAYFGEKGAAGTVKASATIKVKVPKFAKTEYKIKAGAKKIIPVKNVVAAQNPQFSIDNTAVATVEAQLNKKGNPTGKAVVRGVSAGDATLTAIIDGREYTCTIHITGSK